MTTIDSFSLLADEQLLERVQPLAGDERRATVALIAALAELDGRRLYLREGFSSLFSCCTQVLHLSEHAAYGRIEAARAARKFPSLLERLADGDITLTSLCLLAPHLTAEELSGGACRCAPQDQARGRTPDGNAAAPTARPSDSAKAASANCDAHGNRRESLRDAGRTGSGEGGSHY
jgi:hypothetical protein